MKSRHFLALIGILLLGAFLRFWNLDLKPLWLDEVITALFSLGHSYYDIPLNQTFPVSALEQVFTLKPETTCAQIMQTVSTQSVHPPLFFCWLHNWLNWVNPLPQSWIWKLRAFPAAIGVVAIAAIYQLNRVAFSRSAGLLAAAVMAVSPFAVYLSQEARHYTLPILLVILALLGLHHLQADLKHQRYRPAIWFGWIAVNSLGFYVHYFFLMAFVAQVVTLVIGEVVRGQETGDRGQGRGERTILSRLAPLLGRFAVRSLLPIALATTAVCLTYLPWLSTLLSHLSRPETDWLQPSGSGWASAIAPLYRLVVGWILMVIALPVENQPAWIAVISGIVMFLVAVGLGWQLVKRIQGLWQTPDTHDSTRMLLTYTLVVLLEFLVTVYGLGKDITLVPRYNFIYFPAVCALVGAALGQKGTGNRGQGIGVIWGVLFVGVLSSVLTISNLVFQKPYYPDQVADTMRVDPTLPLVVATAYADFQDVALGLSFALALRQQEVEYPDSIQPSDFVFLSRSSGYEPVWSALTTLEPQPTFPLNLWIVAPGLKRKAYPDQLSLPERSNTQERCSLDPAQHYRIGIPYQLYRCGTRKE